MLAVCYRMSKKRPLAMRVSPSRNAEGVPVSRSGETGPETAEQREDLVRRVASSSTFERSPRLRAFFLHVCRCALDNQPELATEQQIGIHVFGRSPGYNPNEDNIVRSQARLLRLKLEHHFAHEGKDEAVLITIPKGRYMPAFERRFEPPAVLPAAAPSQAEVKPRRRRLLLTFVALTVVLGIATVWLGNMVFRSKAPPSVSPASALPRQEQTEAGRPAGGPQVAATPGAGEIRIRAGSMGAPYVDIWGRRWESDRYYEGGVSKPGPQDLFPPVPDPGVFKTMREAASAEYIVPQSQREFRYHIPVHPGVYELRLYFADPVRHANMEAQQDAQNTRHFQVSSNGRSLLSGFDPIADAGHSPVDVRVFKDIAPAADGEVHLAFVPAPEQPFVNALELTPGTPGKLKPIRISAHKSDFVDGDGTRWSGDNYFIGGRTVAYANPEPGPKVPALYTDERFGNFSYAIPVPPGSYTVRLHFAETFFSPLIQAAGLCHGVGCRVFDVTCNGVALLQDFDIVQAAPGAFRPVVRTFHGLRPNGQGKLLLSFSPKVNYAEVRAIEVIDEAK
jgi:hypothetical protein